jgi:hypothetical protein
MKILITLAALAALLSISAAGAQTTAQAETFVHHIYSEYTTPPKRNTPDFLNKEVTLVFSPALVRLIRADQRHTHKGTSASSTATPSATARTGRNSRLRSSTSPKLATLQRLPM